MIKGIPELAIVESNTLAALGLKTMLESEMPMVKISTFGTFGEYEASNPDRFIHCFASMHIVLAHRQFFTQGKRAHHTIVLTPSSDPNSQLQDFHCLCVNVPESQLIKELLNLQHAGHPHGEHLPAMSHPTQEKALSDSTRQNQQEDCRTTMHRTYHSHHTSQEYTREIGHQERLSPHHLCSNAWLCRHQSHLTSLQMGIVIPHFCILIYGDTYLYIMTKPSPK